MINLNIDQLLSVSENKFLLSNALGTRAKQISEGSLPYVDDFNAANPIITAMKEIASGKVKVKMLVGPSPKIKESAIEKVESRLLSLAREKKSSIKTTTKKKKK